MELLKDSRKKDWFWLENEVIDNSSLSMHEKMAYITLARYADNESMCFPSNATIAKKMGCSINTARKAIKSLEEKQLIKKIPRKKNEKENDSNLYCVMSLRGMSRDDIPIAPDDRGVCQEMIYHIASDDRGVCHQVIGKKTYNKKTYIKSNIYSPTEQEEKGNDKEIHKRIIDYLNEKADKSFKSTTKKTKSLIDARLAEGFVEEDFYKVIDNKVHAWLENAKMSVYLRPETIFGNKFESYLNEQTKMAKNGNDEVKRSKEVSKNKFANFEQTFTQYSNKELDEIIKKSQKVKFKK
ncbi:hypothetical protein CDFC105_73081 [Clostridioides difficile]|nr:hypothetical protein CDFC105_60663 [Clostridioides difficile]CZS09300.1 hypothetical protein CDFC105_73081 [Clostridioides difficile]